MKNEIIKIASSYLVENFTLHHYDSIAEFWDFFPSWQHSFESIQITKEDFINIDVFKDKKLKRYCVFEPHPGDIAQLAVYKAYRRSGVASLLLREITKRIHHPNMKLINADINCNSIVEFIKSKNIEITRK